MRFSPQAPNTANLLLSEIMAEKRTNDIAARASESIRGKGEHHISSMSSDNVADQAGGEWKWALSQTKGKVYMYNTADRNKVFWLHDLKDAYQAYVTCKDAIDEADQAGGEWKWALSKTKGKVYMYNTANKVFWLQKLTS